MVGWCGIQGYQQSEVHGLLQALEGREGIRAWTAEVSLRLDGRKVDAGLPGTGDVKAEKLGAHLYRILALLAYHAPFVSALKFPRVICSQQVG